MDVKAVYRTEKWKRHSKNRARKEARARERRRSYRRRANQSHVALGRAHDSGFDRDVGQHRRYYRFPGPDRFSLTENPEDYLAFLQDVRRTFAQRLAINFDLTGVKRVTPDGIAAFVAHLKDPRFHHNQKFRGVNPSDGEPSKVIVESGFYDYFAANGVPVRDSPSRSVHRVTKRKVEPGIAKAFAENAVAFSFRRQQKLHPLYEVLIECMANTKNHASPRGEGHYNWWLFQYCDKKTKRTHFTFLDLGVGIFESINIQTYRRFLNVVQGRDNTDIMYDIVDGKVPSRTGRRERGKGLPLVYRHAQNSFFDVFYILSNNVLFDLKTREARRLKTDFNGTMLYWELIDARAAEEKKQLLLWKR